MRTKRMDRIESRFIYVAYAQDANGTGFRLVPDQNSLFKAIITSPIALADEQLTASLFEGRWLSGVGIQGPVGPTGATGATGPTGVTGAPGYGVILSADTASLKYNGTIVLGLPLVVNVTVLLGSVVQSGVTSTLGTQTNCTVSKISETQYSITTITAGQKQASFIINITGPVVVSKVFHVAIVDNGIAAISAGSVDGDTIVLDEQARLSSGILRRSVSLDNIRSERSYVLNPKSVVIGNENLIGSNDPVDSLNTIAEFFRITRVSQAGNVVTYDTDGDLSEGGSISLADGSPIIVGTPIFVIGLHNSLQFSNLDGIFIYKGVVSFIDNPYRFRIDFTGGYVPQNTDLIFTPGYTSYNDNRGFIFGDNNKTKGGDLLVVGNQNVSNRIGNVIFGNRNNSLNDYQQLFGNDILAQIYGEKVYKLGTKVILREFELTGIYNGSSFILAQLNETSFINLPTGRYLFEMTFFGTNDNTRYCTWKWKFMVNITSSSFIYISGTPFSGAVYLEQYESGFTSIFGSNNISMNVSVVTGAITFTMNITGNPAYGQSRFSCSVKAKQVLL